MILILKIIGLELYVKYYNKINYQYPMNGMMTIINKNMKLNHNMLMMLFMEKFLNINKNMILNNYMMDGQLHIC